MKLEHKHFKDYALSEELLKALEILNYTAPTAVQAEVIPRFLERKDIIVKSQTGSGKTAAFAIPLCQMIDWEEQKPQALVITPTRELALQVGEDIFNIGRYERLKVATVFGKSPFRRQEKELKQRTHVVVGTPGRLIDHLDRGTLDLSKVAYLVIDEADEMLRMGFVEQVSYILDHLPTGRTSIVLSATMPPDIESLCASYMKDPIMVEIEEADTAVERIEQLRFMMNQQDKIQGLKALMTVENPDSCIVFCNTQVMVDELCERLNEGQSVCEKIHGGMEQDERTAVMERFRRGKFRYLVATDVAARGIDIDDIGLVINYDVPNTAENYVHRIGRTGRIGRQGKALTLVSPEEQKLLNDIHSYLDRVIDLGTLPSEVAVLSAESAYLDKLRLKPVEKVSKGDLLSKDILKLHINAGRKTKMRNGDIVGTLCSIEGVSAEDIGIINILDISTFVEILNGKGDYVLKQLQHKTIKGRLRKVTRADR